MEDNLFNINVFSIFFRHVSFKFNLGCGCEGEGLSNEKLGLKSEAKIIIY